MRSDVADALEWWRVQRDADRRGGNPAAVLADAYAAENDPTLVTHEALGLASDNSTRYFRGDQFEKVCVYLGYSSDGSSRWCAVVDSQPFSSAMRVETLGKLRTLLRLLGVADADVP